MSLLIAIASALWACQVDTSFEEKRLATIPDGFDELDIVCSRDGRHVAYRAERSGDGVTAKKMVMVVNDKAGKEYDELCRPTFLDDGATVFYSATRDGHEYLVVGEREFGPYPVNKVLPGTPKPGSDVVPFAAKTDEGWFVFAGAEKYGPFDRAFTPVFAPKGERIAFRAKNGGRWFVMIGKEKGEEFDGVEDPRFSADGSCVAYAATAGGKAFVVVQGKREEEFDSVMTPIFAPSGGAYAYVARKNKKYFVVHNGRRSEGYDALLPYTIGEYGIGPVFSADGKTLAYAFNVGAKLDHGFPSGGTWRIKYGEKTSEAFDRSQTDPQLFPDGSSVIYEAEKGGEHMLMVGDKEIGPYHVFGKAAFSEDGKFFACTASADLKSYLVLSGRPPIMVSEGDILGEPVIHPKGTAVGVGARIGRELWWKVFKLE